MLLFHLALIAAHSCLVVAIPVIIGAKVTNTPDNNFSWTGVNFDFWPTTKPKWEGAGALVSDLTAPSLRALARGLSGSLLRLGGSPADFLLYDVSPDACSQANLNKTQPPPGGKGYFCPIWDQTVGQCLTLARWQALLTFAKDAGLSLVMDLNGCWGRTSATSDMDWSMIDGLLDSTAAAAGTWGGALWGVELSNEVYGNIAPAVYGAAVLRLRTKLDELWPEPAAAPRIMGPDCWENDLSPSYYSAMLAASKPSPSAPSALHAITFHDYGDDCCAPTEGNVLNVTCLDALFASAAWVRDLAGKEGVRVWNGEGALHSSSGVSGLTNTALSTLYYLHALGSYADNGFGLFSRQTLLGGDYGLTNRTTLQPTPDYWGLLAWRRLVSGGALGARVALNRRGVLALGVGALFVRDDLHAQDLSRLKLLEPTPEDHILGNRDAPNTLIDYASFTCPHCANFYIAVLPTRRREWIDTGRLRLIHRHFPSDLVASRAAQITECVPPDRTALASGSTATIFRPGSLGFSALPTPVIVPPVPTPATKMSSLPPVSFQISSAVVRMCTSGLAGFSNCCGMKLSGTSLRSSSARAIAPFTPFSRGVNSRRAPRKRSILRRSIDIESGMVTIIL